MVLSFISYVFAGLLYAHPLHVSVTSLEIDTQQKAFTVSHKFYTNDFSLLFYHLFEKNIDPKIDKAFSPFELDLINIYMKNRFMLVSGRDTIPMGYIRKEQDEESIWLYYSGKLSKHNMKSLIISNLLLLDLYMDQTNLLIVTNGNKESGITFNYKNQCSTIDIRGE